MIDKSNLKKGIWITRDGRPIPICKMNWVHLKNCIRLIRRTGARSEYLPLLLDEYQFRKNKPFELL